MKFSPLSVRYFSEVNASHEAWLWISDTGPLWVIVAGFSLWLIRNRNLN
jgi:hypothetical protein